MARYFRDETELFDRAQALNETIKSFPATEQLAQRVVAHHQAWPQTKPATKLAMAQSGFDPNSPIAKEAARLSQQRQKKKGFFTHLNDTWRTGVRSVALVAAAPFEEGAGILRSIAGTIGGRAGGAAAGATGGAAIGASLGLVGGPLAPLTSTAGGVIGGAIGGVAGLLGGDDIEGEGGFRSQSTLGQALKGLEVGTGYIPGKEAHVAAAEAARKTATIGGKGLTLGRLTANAVVEPGTTPYNVLSGLVDSGAAMKLDPAALAGAKASRVIAARRTILSEKAGQAFLNTDAGAKLVDNLSQTMSPWEILTKSKHQLPVDVAVRLADETDSSKVRALLDGELGTTVRSKFQTKVKRLGRARLFNDIPGDTLNWDDPAGILKGMDGFLAQGRVSGTKRVELLDKMARAAVGPRTGRLEAVNHVSDAVAEVMVSHGLAPDLAQEMARLVPKSLADANAYTAAELALNHNVPGLVINSEGHAINAPQLLSEFLNTGIKMPSRQAFREMRRQANFLAPIYRTKGLGEAIKKSDILLTGLTNQVWKAGVLMRLALPVRVGGEEQIRMATAGYDSVFSHPWSYIMRHVQGRGKVAITGDNLLDSIQGQQAMAKGGGAHFLEQSKMLVTKHRQRYKVGEEGFIRGWRDHELGHLRADPIAQHVAKHGTDATKDWLETGKGQKFLKELWEHKPDDPTFMRSRMDIESYLDDIVGPRVKEFTRGDQRLLDHIASGTKSGPDERIARQAINPVLDELTAAGNHPQWAMANLAIPVTETAGGVYSQATSTMFSFLIEKPTNTLNRSKVFAQAYWNRSIELAGDLAPDAQRTLLTNARKAKLAATDIKKIENAIAKSSGELGIDHVDYLAKGFGLEETQGLLYDLAKKSQFSDALRVAAPFAEPWREMMITWSKLLKENPQAPRRFQQVVEGARGAGFFKVDEQTGEEVFVYPGSEFITKKLLGVPLPFKATTKGLNLFANSPLMPGMGPIVQIPAGILIPNKPEWDWLQDTLNPYGRSKEGIVEQFVAPATWMDKARKIFADPESDRMFGNTVYDISRYLVSTGEYSTDSPEEQERLSKAAISKAKGLYALRTLASFSAPSAPTPEFQSALKDTSGRLLTQFKLVEESRKLQDEDYDSAVEVFLDKYGEEALLYMQPKTKGGGPATDEMNDWVRSHPTEVSRFPGTYHFFGPRTGEFSYTAYERQLATGERQSISPKEAVELANNRVASMLWRAAKDKVGDKPLPHQKQWLDNVKATLLKEYPGYTPEPQSIGKVPQQIRELQSALESPTLAKTPVGEALDLYFLARNKAISTAKAAGLQSFSRSKRMAGTRLWLRQIADKLIDDYPDFAAVFEQVLDREMAQDEPEAIGEELPNG